MPDAKETKAGRGYNVRVERRVRRGRIVMPFGKSKGYCNQGGELIKANQKLADMSERVVVLEKAISDHRWNHTGEPSENDRALWGNVTVNP